VSESLPTAPSRHPPHLFNHFSPNPSTHSSTSHPPNLFMHSSNLPPSQRTTSFERFPSVDSRYSILDFSHSLPRLTVTPQFHSHFPVSHSLTSLTVTPQSHSYSPVSQSLPCFTTPPGLTSLPGLTVTQSLPCLGLAE
jgi:hypothetical protein